MNMPLSHPGATPIRIDAVSNVSHCARLIANEAMARAELAIRGDAQISRAGAAWVRTMRSTMDFAECADHIGKSIASASQRPFLKDFAASDHFG